MICCCDANCMSSSQQFFIDIVQTFLQIAVQALKCKVVNGLLAACRFAMGGMRIDGTILQQEFLPDDFMRHWVNNFTTILTHIKVRPELRSREISCPQ